MRLGMVVERSCGRKSIIFIASLVSGGAWRMAHHGSGWTIHHSFRRSGLIGAFSSHQCSKFTTASDPLLNGENAQISISESELSRVIEEMRRDLERLIYSHRLPKLPHPVLKAVLRQFGSFRPKVDQVMILHGPKGVGKRTAVEEIISEWNSSSSSPSPHAVAYVNFEAANVTGWKHSLSPWTPTQYTKPHEFESHREKDLGLLSISIHPPDHSATYEASSHNQFPVKDEKFMNDRFKFIKSKPGEESGDITLHSNPSEGNLDMVGSSKQVHEEDNYSKKYDSLRAGVCDLDVFRDYLEMELEALAIDGVRCKKLNSQMVFSCLALNHAIDDILLIILREKFDIFTTSSFPQSSNDTEHLWNKALDLWSLDFCPLNHRPVNKMSRDDETVSNNYVRFQNLHWDSNLVRDSDLDFKKTIHSLSLAKYVFRIFHAFRSRERPKKKFGGFWKSQVRSAVLWPSFLVEVISDAVEENVYQPKLIINGLHLLRKAESFKDYNAHLFDGSAYHDCFLSRLIIRAVNEKSLPVILISSDSYYSHYLHNDFGTEIVFEPFETFGWMPEEMDIHLQNNIFNPNQWNIISGVLGSNIRHLAEFYAIWKGKYSYLTPPSEVEEMESIENCLEEYVTFLQVTEIEPAMDTALKLVEKWALNVHEGRIPYWEMSWGTAWRNPPKLKNISVNSSNPHTSLNQWARFQMIDLLEALASTQFAANYEMAAGTELLEDPAVQALLKVGILYMQRNPPIVRPMTRVFQRCLTRWLIREKLHLTSLEKLQYFWLRVHKGRSYRHLMP